MQENINQLIKDYNHHTKCSKELYDMIFSHDEMFKKRILEMSKEIIRGRKEPETCCDEYAIPFGLINVYEKGEENPFEHYYGRYIEWSIKGNNVIAKIETVFRGENDSYFEFLIPVDNKEYQLYLQELREKADKRVEKTIEEKTIAEKEKEKQEIKLLRELKEKYEKYFSDKTTESNENNT